MQDMILTKVLDFEYLIHTHRGLDDLNIQSFLVRRPWQEDGQDIGWPFFHPGF